MRCDKKPARLGKEHGYEDHRFCSLQCAYRYAIEGTMDQRWCGKHGQWYERDGCWDCNHEDGE